MLVFRRIASVFHILEQRMECTNVRLLSLLERINPEAHTNPRRMLPGADPARIGERVNKYRERGIQFIRAIGVKRPR